MSGFLRAADDVVESQDDPGEITGLRMLDQSVRVLYGIYMKCKEIMNPQN